MVSLLKAPPITHFERAICFLPEPWQIRFLKSFQLQIKMTVGREELALREIGVGGLPGWFSRILEGKG